MGIETIKIRLSPEVERMADDIARQLNLPGKREVIEGCFLRYGHLWAQGLVPQEEVIDGKTVWVLRPQVIKLRKPFEEETPLNQTLIRQGVEPIEEEKPKTLRDRLAESVGPIEQPELVKREAARLKKRQKAADRQAAIRESKAAAAAEAAAAAKLELEPELEPAAGLGKVAQRVARAQRSRQNVK